MMIEVEQLRDRDYLYKDDRVSGIVTMLLEADEQLYDEVVAFLQLNGNSNYESQLTSMVQLIGDKPEQLNILLNHLHNLINLYQDDDLRNHLRGAVLEKFVDELLKSNNFSRTSFYLNCYLLIDEWKSTKTVDNFSYSSSVSKGECFECKIQPINLDDDDINNLNEIYLKSDYSINPCVACFALEKSIEKVLEEILHKNRDVITRNIIIFGSEKLKSIPSFLDND